MFASGDFTPEDSETEDIELNDVLSRKKRKEVTFPLEKSWIQSKVIVIYLFILILSLWIILWGNQTISFVSNKFNILNNWELLIAPGADIVGGMAIVLEPIFSEEVYVHQDSLYHSINKFVIDNDEIRTDLAYVQRIDNRHFQISIPGSPDLEGIKDLLVIGDFVEFVHLGSHDLEIGTYIRTTANSNWLKLIGVEDVESYESFETIITGASLVNANANLTNQGDYAIHFYLDRHGAERLEEYTIANQGEYLAITLNGQIIFAAQVDEPIVGGQVSIVGGFSSEQANEFARHLQEGIGKIPFTVSSTHKIPSVLGDNSEKIFLLSMGIMALFVISWMLYFRLPGIICLGSLFTYSVVLLALFYLLPVMFSIPGIICCILLMGLVVVIQTKLLRSFRRYAKQGRRLLSVIDLSWKKIWQIVYKPSILATLTSFCLYWLTKKFNIMVLKSFTIIAFYGIPIGIFLCVIATRFLLEAFISKIKATTRIRWYRIWN